MSKSPFQEDEDVREEAGQGGQFLLPLQVAWERGDAAWEREVAGGAGGCGPNVFPCFPPAASAGIGHAAEVARFGCADGAGGQLADEINGHIGVELVVEEIERFDAWNSHAQIGGDAEQPVPIDGARAEDGDGIGNPADGRHGVVGIAMQAGVEQLIGWIERAGENGFDAQGNAAFPEMRVGAAVGGFEEHMPVEVDGSVLGMREVERVAETEEMIDGGSGSGQTAGDPAFTDELADERGAAVFGDEDVEVGHGAGGHVVVVQNREGRTFENERGNAGGFEASEHGFELAEQLLIFGPVLVMDRAQFGAKGRGDALLDIAVDERKKTAGSGREGTEAFGRLGAVGIEPVGGGLGGDRTREQRGSQQEHLRVRGESIHMRD